MNDASSRSRLPRNTRAPIHTVDDVHVYPLLDSNGESDAVLRIRFERDGYLFLRGFLAEEDVVAARNAVYRNSKQPSLLSQPELAQLPAVLAVLEAAKLERVASLLLHTQAKPLVHKWLRGVPLGLYTGVHCDRVFVG